MNPGAARRNGHEFGSGALSRATAFVYWHLIVGLLACAVELPVVALLFFLDRSAQNLPLVPLCLILAAPAMSAAIYALRHRERAEGLTPARSFFAGLRIGWADALRAWTPPMIALAAVATGLLSLETGGIPAGYAGVLLVLGVLFLLWGINALVIATVFSFRWRDTMRLAVFFLGRRWLVTIGYLALLLVAAAVVYASTEAVFWLFQVVWLAFLVVTARPLIDDVTGRFTAQ